MFVAPHLEHIDRVAYTNPVGLRDLLDGRAALIRDVVVVAGPLVRGSVPIGLEELALQAKLASNDTKTQRSTHEEDIESHPARFLPYNHYDLATAFWARKRHVGSRILMCDGVAVVPESGSIRGEIATVFPKACPERAAYAGECHELIGGE